MDIKNKQRLLRFVQQHDDGSQEAKDLLKILSDNSTYADTESYSVSPEDLEGSPAQATLRSKLGKAPGEPFTVDDCQRVANAIDDCIAEDFSEHLNNAINYCL